MGLVDDHIVPFYLAKGVQADPDALETRHHDVELHWGYVVVDQISSLLLGGNQLDHSFVGQPLLDLIGPVAKGDLGTNH